MNRREIKRYEEEEKKNKGRNKTIRVEEIERRKKVTGDQRNLP